MKLNADAKSYEKIEKLMQIKRNVLEEQLKRSMLNLNLVAEVHNHREGCSNA